MLVFVVLGTIELNVASDDVLVLPGTRQPFLCYKTWLVAIMCSAGLAYGIKISPWC